MLLRIFCCIKCQKHENKHVWPQTDPGSVQPFKIKAASRSLWRRLVSGPRTETLHGAEVSLSIPDTSHSDTDTRLCSRPGLSPRLGSDPNTGPGWTHSVLLFSCRVNIQWRNVNKETVTARPPRRLLLVILYYLCVSSCVDISSDILIISLQMYQHQTHCFDDVTLTSSAALKHPHIRSSSGGQETVHPPIYQMSFNNSVTSSSDGQNWSEADQSINQWSTMKIIISHI